MRIVLLGRQPQRGLFGQRLAGRLGVPSLDAGSFGDFSRLLGVSEFGAQLASLEGFVLHGIAESPDQCLWLDRTLGARAAEVDVALWVNGGPSNAASDDLLNFYGRRVCEVPVDDDADSEAVLEKTLERLREYWSMRNGAIGY